MQELIATYYQTYRGGNASTEDFTNLARTICGNQSEAILGAWLRMAIVPPLDSNEISWETVQAQLQQLHEENAPSFSLILTDEDKEITDITWKWVRLLDEEQDKDGEIEAA